ncbi:Uncharacterized protein FWK35_00014051 [Aphis craccivora]|uniref:Uncharacterized protein n=1 Tax=Aphis craccivora TaxID=307492 RepID=A0A6G0YY03_APHCR|nr:Uncharacterized protein FWK35_00014051 [Aphis craccivora]
MSRRDGGQRSTTPEYAEDRRSDISGTIYQTVSYDADDEKSSGSSLPTRTPPDLLYPCARKKNVAKKKKLAKPAGAVTADDVDQLIVDTSVLFVSDNNKIVL